MVAVKNRIKRLEQMSRGRGGDDEIIVIRLTYGGQEDQAIPPIVCRRGPAGHLVRRIGIDTIPENLRRDAIIE